MIIIDEAAVTTLVNTIRETIPLDEEPLDFLQDVLIMLDKSLPAGRDEIYAGSLTKEQVMRKFAAQG